MILIINIMNRLWLWLIISIVNWRNYFRWIYSLIYSINLLFIINWFDLIFIYIICINIIYIIYIYFIIIIIVLIIIDPFTIMIMIPLWSLYILI